MFAEQTLGLQGVIKSYSDSLREFKHLSWGLQSSDRGLTSCLRDYNLLQMGQYLDILDRSPEQGISIKLLKTFFDPLLLKRHNINNNDLKKNSDQRSHIIYLYAVAS